MIQGAGYKKGLSRRIALHGSLVELGLSKGAMFIHKLYKLFGKLLSELKDEPLPSWMAQATIPILKRIASAHLHEMSIVELPTKDGFNVIYDIDDLLPTI